MASLADIRARLQQAEDNKGGRAKGPSDNAIFPHWNIDKNDSATIRFLPDADPNNTFFWIERQMIRLPFNGIKGETDKQTIVQVPCVEMWGDTCPVHTEIRPWFKDPSLETMARTYWKKRSYLFQGFVRESNLEESAPSNPIRRFIISTQIFNIIKSALMDPELEELPTNFERGLDFRVNKTEKGQYADYSTSKWARKESSLTGDELAAIEEHGLYNLTDFLPKRPSDEEVRIIKEMFEASVDGEAYDPERFGAYYRPAGMQAPAGAQRSTAQPTAAPAPAAESRPAPAPVTNVTTDTPLFEVDSAPAAAPASSMGGNKAEDILAMIRARQSS